MTLPAPKKQFNIYLPEELIRAVKHSAVDAQRSLSEHVEHLLRDALHRAADPASSPTPTREDRTP